MVVLFEGTFEFYTDKSMSPPPPLPFFSWNDYIMTSFRVTGHLCGEFAGHRWNPALMFSLICAWIHSWINNREAGDVRRHRAHYDITLMALLTSNDYILPPIGRPMWYIVYRSASFGRRLSTDWVRNVAFCNPYTHWHQLELFDYCQHMSVVIVLICGSHSRLS